MKQEIVYIREFLKRYVGNWLQLLFGPLALVFTIYGVFASSGIYNRLFFTALLIVGLCISSYLVWRKEYLRTLETEFPNVQYPGGAREFAITKEGHIVAEYVVVEDLTITNRSSDKPVNIKMYVQITRRPTYLMFSPENEQIPNWRELAHVRDVPNSNQLTFPLTILPKTSVGGNAIFLLSRNMRYGVAGLEGAQDEWFVYVEEISSGKHNLFPINVVSCNRADGSSQSVYARRF